MNHPIFWIGISLLLVAISLMVLLAIAIFTLQELARAARSAEKLLDTLNRELPATLNDLRLTGKELSDLSQEVSSGVQSARNVADQVDQGIAGAKDQAHRLNVTTRSLWAGTAAALGVLFTQPQSSANRRRRRQRPPTRRPPVSPMPADPRETDARQTDARAADVREANPQPADSQTANVEAASSSSLESSPTTDSSATNGRIDHESTDREKEKANGVDLIS